MNTLDFIDNKSLRDDIPEFRAGDTLDVHVKVIEGSKERIQVFKGVVIRRQGGGVRAGPLGDEVGVGARRLGQPLMPWPHRQQILVDHRIGRASPLALVAQQPADEADVCRRIHEDPDVEQGGQVRLDGQTLFSPLALDSAGNLRPESRS